MLSKEQLKQILTEQRESILKKSTGIERTILKDIEPKIKLPRVIVLTGIRRCGKSTILRQIIDKYYSNTDFYYINFEDERLFNFNASEFNNIYETLVELFGKKTTFFIDEIQNITNFETFVRRFNDNGYKFYITGSNAKLLSKELGTKLTGRHLDMVVVPFSFPEYLKLKQYPFETSMLYKTETRAEIKNHFREYLAKGGMPEYLLYDDIEILARIYEDIVIKDIVVRYHIENIAALKELYQYLITNNSNRFSFNSLKNIIPLGSVNTIKRYISYLEESHFAKVISKFDYSLKKQLINDKKLYVLDNGFIRAVSTKLTKDNGWLLENLVFNVLGASSKIYYHSSAKECDFVVLENKNINSVIQVTWQLNDHNKKREFDGLVDAMDKFKLKKGTILTYDQEDEIKKENKTIIIKPVWKWLLENP
ncbi:MAG: ATP-binding protein [Candidatus Nanohalarchaeota archaeon]|nr:MAG: ATP-binding protein [Candidatus Nanohaloarchaeota archaeon]